MGQTARSGSGAETGGGIVDDAMQRRIWLSALLGAALFLSACGSRSARPGPDDVVLRLSDLPAQTKLDLTRSWNNRQAAARDGVSVDTYSRHGRITSREVRFVRNVMNGSEPTWLLRAENEVTEYRDGAGARWGYSALRATMRRAFVWGATTLGTNSGQAHVRTPFRPLGVPRVGDADAGFTVNSGGDEVAWTTRVLIFRRDRYVVFLRVMGLIDDVAMSRVIALGRIIDHRITPA